MRTPISSSRTITRSGDRRRMAPSRRGVTFLEIVLGVVLMSMVAGTLSIAVGAIGGSFQRQRDRLGAAEISSRLLLMRADDEDSLPPPAATIAYGERAYRWTMDERPVQVTLSEPARAAIADGSTTGSINLSQRMVAITVTAWLSEDTGGTVQFDPDVPHYTLTRLIDIIDFTTSDSAERRLETQEDIQRYMGGVVGSMSSGEVSTGGTRQRGAQPQRGRPADPAANPNPNPRRNQRDGGRGGGGG